MKVWVSAKSESFPPTRFSMSHIFLRSDTNHHVQTKSQIWVILIFEENSEWKIEIITKMNYYEERKLRKWSYYEDSGIDLVPSHLIQFKPIFKLSSFFHLKPIFQFKPILIIIKAEITMWTNVKKFLYFIFRKLWAFAWEKKKRLRKLFTF